jgi:hypothetical protein
MPKALEQQVRREPGTLRRNTLVENDTAEEGERVGLKQLVRGGDGCETKGRRGSGRRMRRAKREEGAHDGSTLSRDILDWTRRGRERTDRDWRW